MSIDTSPPPEVRREYIQTIKNIWHSATLPEYALDYSIDPPTPIESSRDRSFRSAVAKLLASSKHQNDAERRYGHDELMDGLLVRIRNLRDELARNTRPHRQTPNHEPLLRRRTGVMTRYSRARNPQRQLDSSTREKDRAVRSVEQHLEIVAAGGLGDIEHRRGAG